jgi:hypothetical protein
MWCLKNRVYEPVWETPYSGTELQLFQSTLSNRLRVGGMSLGTDGDRIGENDENPKYSKGLRALIHECLLIQPPSRPTPEMLVARTKRGLESARMTSGMIINQEPDPVALQPELSARWYSVGPYPDPEEDTAAQHSPRVSELVQLADQAKIDETKRLKQNAIQSAMLGARLVTQKRNSPLNRLGRRGSVQLRQTAAMATGRAPSTPYGVLEDMEDAMNDAMGVEIGKGLNAAGGFLRAGMNADLNQLAAAMPSQGFHNTSHREPGPAPPPDGVGPLPAVTFIVMDRVMFGGVRHRTLKVEGLYASMTILQLKANLNTRDVRIPLERMVIRRGNQVLDNAQSLAVLDGTVILRVNEE